MNQKHRGRVANPLTGIAKQITAAVKEQNALIRDLKAIHATEIKALKAEFKAAIKLAKSEAKPPYIPRQAKQTITKPKNIITVPPAHRGRPLTAAGIAKRELAEAKAKIKAEMAAKLAALTGHTGKRGRPAGSKNVVKTVALRGRPFGSKNKPVVPVSPLKGRKMSEETKAKIRAGIAARKAALTVVAPVPVAVQPFAAIAPVATAQPESQGASV